MFLKKMMIVLMLVSLPVMVGAVSIDTDGILGAAWDAPGVGNVPTGYVLKYIINGVDSVDVECIGLKDSSVVLTNVGDWAILGMQSYYEYWSSYNGEMVRVFSSTVVSDTIVFEEAVVVDPPAGIRWE